MITSHFLDETAAEDFVAHNWQRHPVLFADAFRDYSLPFDSGDLFDLACESQAQSRLVTREGQSWNVKDGPLEPRVLSELPTQDWSLLIQSVETWVPELHELIGRFGFLPRWRIDDVMVSLSAAGGGVGPHVDQYDVFLIQGQGRRSWAFGGPAGKNLPDRPLRLLADFKPDEQHILEPGDALYLPPGVAHDGIALDDGCLTISVGFRAPGVSDLASKFADQLLDRWADDAEHEPRFRDPGRASSTGDPSLITGSDAQSMADLVTSCLSDPDHAMRLAGELMSEPRMPPNEPTDQIEPGDIMSRLAAGQRLERWSGSRLAYGPATNGKAYLFADGASVICRPDIASAIAQTTEIDAQFVASLSSDADIAEVLSWLVRQGTFGFPED